MIIKSGSALGRGCTAFLALLFLCVTTSCGGSGGVKAQDMRLLEFLLVDRALQPVSPTETTSLPRNAQLLLVFSELVNPDSINSQTVQIRFGPNLQSRPIGSFSVTGNTVRFDPTITSDGQPNPFGLDPVVQYQVLVPGFGSAPDVLQNADFDPVLDTFETKFTTGDGYLRELTPPEVIGVGFTPEADDLTGNIPGNAVFHVDFSEPMDPRNFRAGAFNGATPNTTIDVRYTTDTINVGAGLTTVMPDGTTPVGVPITGTWSPSPSATRYFFRPTFSFGDAKYRFFAQLFQGLTDLSGNQLVNPGSFGVYTCDGNGISVGKVIEEDFLDTDSVDFTASDADWGSTEEGVLQGLPITTRKTYLFGYQETDSFGSLPDSGRGHYQPLADPLVGASLNQAVPNVNPPTAEGRRVLWALTDAEMGASGAVTEAAWGPDSNATYAATYPNVILRMGHQANDSISLSSSFSANYKGDPVKVYEGAYTVGQAANIGNTPFHPLTAHVPGYPVAGACTANWNQPLFDSTGFLPWPALTTFFEWDAGAPGVEGDSAFLFDASVQEGDNFQQLRSWFAFTIPCGPGIIASYPLRRFYSTYENNDPRPGNGGGILNPEPTVMDACFTITKRTSIGQSLFYFEAGNPIQASHGNTFGDDTVYRPVEATPRVQSGGAQVIFEFQGADLVEDDRRTINVAGLFTDWTQDISDLDGMQKMRWRVRLVSNLFSGARARLTRVRIPMTDE